MSIKINNSHWNILDNECGIYSINFNNHKDDVEMSGEKVSGIVGYSVTDNQLSLNLELIYPMLRIPPNKTCDSYKVKINGSSICFYEIFERVEFDGVLTLYSKTNDLNITRRFYPSTKLPIFYEEIEITNINENTIKLDYEPSMIIDKREGIKKIICQRLINQSVTEVKSKENIKLIFAYVAHYIDEEVEIEKNALIKRKVRVNELFELCKLETDNPILNVMFKFAKLRAGESVFNTQNGLIHSPGGGNYYAAIWCNDECEYATPWFAFNKDDILQTSVKNSMKWYFPYFNDLLKPIPSSIISEGIDYWNGAGDRGDASMFLYGNTRYFLTTNEKPNDLEFNALKWCSQYIESKINNLGIVESDSDELENRLSSGEANLNTNSISYKAFKNYSVLLERMGLDKEAKYYDKLADNLKENIIKFFSANIRGYETYRYHEGCDEIRAWNALPLYMGISHNVSGTVDSIEDNLWTDGSLRSTEGEKILWDRSSLYYISALFKSWYTYLGYTKLFEYSKTRLLGDRVPYAVEAYPEYNMRHLSGESALYCRIITDGILGIEFTVDGFTITPKMGPLKYFKLENFYCNGKEYTILIQDGFVKISTEDTELIEPLGKIITVK